MQAEAVTNISIVYKIAEKEGIKLKYSPWSTMHMLIKAYPSQHQLGDREAYEKYLKFLNLQIKSQPGRVFKDLDESKQHHAIKPIIADMCRAIAAAVLELEERDKENFVTNLKFSCLYV